MGERKEEQKLIEDAILDYVITMNNQAISLEDISVNERIHLAVLIDILGLRNDNILTPLYNLKNISTDINEIILILEYMFKKSIINLELENFDAFVFSGDIECHVDRCDFAQAVFSINIVEVITDRNTLKEILTPSYLRNDKAKFYIFTLHTLVSIEFEIFYKYLIEYNLYREFNGRCRDVIHELIEHKSILEIQNAIESAGKYVMSEIMAGRASKNGADMFILNVARKLLKKGLNRNNINEHVHNRRKTLIEKVYFENYLHYFGDVSEFSIVDFFSIQ